MRPADEHAADWKDAAAYAPLLKADRSIFAWEWLRREPEYRSAAERRLEHAGAPPPGERQPRPETWGLHAFEPPQLAPPRARPIWRAEVHPYVLRVTAERADAGPDAFDLSQVEATSCLAAAPGRGEHLLISDGLRTIRLDVLQGSVRDGPVRLRYLLVGFAAAEKPLLSLRRLLALQRTGHFSLSLHPDEASARRWLLKLRAHDAVAAGADQREIASQLLSSAASEPRWRSAAPSVRSRVQRLVRSARRMAHGGYRELLR